MIAANVALAQIKNAYHRGRLFAAARKSGTREDSECPPS